MRKNKRILFIIMICFFTLLFMACKDNNSSQNNNPNQNNNSNDYTYEEPDSKEIDLAKIYSSLFNDIDITKVTNNLSFPTNINGVSIVYDSNNKDVISDIGVVKRGEEDVTVNVKITLTYESLRYENTVAFTVLKEETEPNSDLNDLIQAIENFNNCKDNYRLDVKEYYDGEISYEGEYYIDGNVVKMRDVYYEDVNDTDITVFYCVLNDGYIDELYYVVGGEYYLTKDEDAIDEFINYTDFYFDYYDFSFNAEDFYKEGDLYLPKGNNTNSVAKSILGDYERETFKSFSIEIKNGMIYRILATSDYQDVSLYTINYVLLFSEFSKQELTLPDVSENDYKLTNISDVYEMNRGEIVEIRGRVAGFSGKSYYVYDDSGSICVYFESEEFIPEKLELGSYLFLQGTVDTFNGLYEVRVSSRTDVAATPGGDYKKEVFSDLGTIDERYTSAVIDIKDVLISGKNASSDQMTTFDLVDVNGNKMMLVVKKADSEFFNNIFKDINVDLLLNINSLVVIKYYDKLILYILDQTSVEEVCGLRANQNRIVVDKGTAIDDVLKMLSFTYYGKETKELSISDLTYTNNYDSSKAGEYSFVFKYQEEQIQVLVCVRESGIVENADYATLEDVAKEKTTYCPGLPSTGDVNILVIPIKFTNSKDYDLTVIDKAFNGTNSDTGWYSLNGYYQASSYGKLNIIATITDPYETGVSYNLTKGETGVDDYKYFLDAITYFDNTIDYSLYDQNNDGYLDCVYLVYLAPYGTGYKDSDLWWAYCYEYFEEDEEVKFDGVGLDWYLWVSYEFFEEPIYVEYDKIGNEIEESKIYVDINCETIIHETGHAFGLDDYYDSELDKGPDGGVGALVMMDTNQGDHDPFSKAILGWINPTIVCEADYTGKVTSFTDCGDVIFIMKENIGTYFTEFYIISLYNPTKENALKSDKSCGLPSTSGVIIYHIDATIVEGVNDEYGVIDIYKFNNSSTDHKLIGVVEADGENDIELYGDVVSDSDLFQTNDSISLSWYGEESPSFTITFTSVSSEGATFTIDFND